MHRFFLPVSYKEQMTIKGQDAHHIIDVLRMQPGAELQIVADDGISALMEITALGDNTVDIKEKEILRESHEPTVKIRLLQGLAKGDKMDFIIQKAVEIGVTDIYPMALEHSVVKLSAEKAAKKCVRWQKIAEAAAKQSKRDIIPQVHAVSKMSQLAEITEDSLFIVAYESENKLSLKEVISSTAFDNISLLIGPEGGLSTEEVDKALELGGKAVSLGRRILRTETAGLVASTAILYETGNLGL